MFRLLIFTCMLFLSACGHKQIQQVEPVQPIRPIFFKFDPPIVLDYEHNDLTIRNLFTSCVYDKLGNTIYDNSDKTIIRGIIDDYYDSKIKLDTINNINAEKLLLKNIVKYSIHDLIVNYYGSGQIKNPLIDIYNDNESIGISYSYQFRLCHSNLSYNSSYENGKLALKFYNYIDHDYCTNDEIFRKKLQNMYIVLFSNSDISTVSQHIIDKLKTRFQIQKITNKKKENFYKVSFATAKSRLQRAFDNFKYDEAKSIFILEEPYTENVHGKELKLVHTFIISLYPEESGTVIEFSGNYDYLKDTFSGNDKYGSSIYDKNMLTIQQNVENIMKVNR